MGIVGWIIAVAIFVILVISTTSFLKKSGSEFMNSIGNYFKTQSKEQTQEDKYNNAVESMNTFEQQNKIPELREKQEEILADQAIPADKKIMIADSLVAAYAKENNIQKLEALLQTVQQKNIISSSEKIAEYKFKLLQLYYESDDKKIKLKAKSLAEDLTQIHKSALYGQLSYYYLAQLTAEDTSAEMQKKAIEYYDSYSNYIVKNNENLKKDPITAAFIRNYPSEAALYIKAKLLQSSQQKEALTIYKQITNSNNDGTIAQYFIGEAAIVAIELDAGFAKTPEAKQKILALLELNKDPTKLNNKEEAEKIYKLINDKYKDDKEMQQKAAAIMKKE